MNIASRFARGTTCQLAALSLLLGVLGCHRDMRDQSHYEALEATDFFTDGKSARSATAGTVARGTLDGGERFRQGKAHGHLVTELPVPVNRELLERGQARFDIYCSPCHGRTGAGDGMIVQRGFQRPPTFHSDRLRDVPAGHFFDVMTNGFGVMPRYGPQIPEHDRWAIVVYIRALQLSQHAQLSDVPPDAVKQLEKELP